MKQINNYNVLQLNVYFFVINSSICRWLYYWRNL